MRFRVVGHFAALVASLAPGFALSGPATGEARKPAPPHPDSQPGRSSPPDTTPYVRPVIPEDRVWTPPPTREGASSPESSPFAGDRMTKPQEKR
jgi:hypothetical protein